MLKNSFFIQQSGVSGWEQVPGTGTISDGYGFFLAESGSKFGIGTNEPDELIHAVWEYAPNIKLQGTGQRHDLRNFNSYITFADAVGDVGQIGFNSSGTNYFRIQNTASDSGYIILSANPNLDKDFVINKSGDVGIGNDFSLNPKAKIHVVQSGSGIGVRDTESMNNNIALFQMTGSESTEAPEFIVKSDGKIGINNYSPRYTLDISGHKDYPGVSTLKVDSQIYGYDSSYLFTQEKGTAISPNITIDFDGTSFRNVVLSGTSPHFFTTKNGTTEDQEMKSVSIRLYASGGGADFLFDGGINFLGYRPTGMGAENVGVMSFNSFGPEVSDTIAVFRQPGDILHGPQGSPGATRDGEPGEEFRNKIIGGDFGSNPWQRLLPGQTGFYALQSGQYTADRFVYSAAQGAGIGGNIPTDSFTSDSNTLFLLQSDDEDMNFTIEMWVYIDNLPSSQWGMLIMQKGDLPVDSNEASFQLGIAGTADVGGGPTAGTYGHGKLVIARLYDDNSSYLYSDAALSEDTWYHIAIVREGVGTNQVKLYIDGTLDSSWTKTNPWHVNSRPLYIGTMLWNGVVPAAQTVEFDGYMDEIRISNVARWTSDFTPLTTPYADDSNTRLLIHSDTTNGSTTFTDSSSSSSVHTIFAVNDTKHSTSQSKVPTSSSSIYFDGNGDYLTIPDHVDFRFNEFKDSSTSNRTISVLGSSNNTHHSADKAKFGISSINFDGANDPVDEGDHLTIPDHSDFSFGKNPFTIEFWLYLTEYPPEYYYGLMCKGDGNADLKRDFEIFITGPNDHGGGSSDYIPPLWADSCCGRVGVFGLGAANPASQNFAIFSNAILDLNEWHHVAIVREGAGTNQMKLYINGAVDRSWTFTNDVFNSTYPILIGAQGWTRAGASREIGNHTLDCSNCYSWFKGYMEDIRISNVARYNSQGNTQGAGNFNVYKDSHHPPYEGFYFGQDGISYPSTGSLTIECVGTDSGMHTGNTYASDTQTYDEKYHMIEQKIEGHHIKDLISEDFNLSFWAWTENISGLFPVSLRNHDNTISYVTPYDVCNTGEWKKIHLNIPAVTGENGEPILESSFNLNEGVGLSVGWTLASSSGLNVPTGSQLIATKNIYGQDVIGTSGQWISGFYVGFSGHVGGASMVEEAGTILKIANPELKHGWRAGNERSQLRSQQTELELCKRYYERLDYTNSDSIGIGQCIGTGLSPLTNLAGGGVSFSQVPSAEFPASSTDPHWTSTVLLVQSDDSTESQNIVDASPANHGSLTVIGNVHHEQDEYKWPDTSIYMDSSIDYLDLPQSSPGDTSFKFGTADFTVEMWFYIDAFRTQGGYCSSCPHGNEYWSGLITTMSSVYSGGSTTYRGWALGYNDYGQLLWQTLNTFGSMSSPILSPDWTVDIKKWYHIAVSKKSNVIYLYINGVMVISAADAIDYDHIGDMRIGEFYNTHTQYNHIGYLEDIRITKGVGRYCPTCNPFSPVVVTQVEHLLQTTEKFGGVKLDYQDKRIEPLMSNSGNLTVTELTWAQIPLTDVGFEGITKTQTSVSGEISGNYLMAGHATTLKPSGDVYFFIDAEL